MIELIYDHLHGVVKDNLGSEGLRYLPLIVSLFFFIVFLNVLGYFLMFSPQPFIL